MPKQKIEPFTADLSEAEKQDLEKMIGEFRQERPTEGLSETRGSNRAQLDSVTRRLGDLTEMVLSIDRQLAPLAEIVRLSHKKSELLSQRLDTVIAALKKGRMI
jgi:hypothetical protein